MQNFGIVTPVLTMLPRAHAQWERSAGIDEVRAIAVEADRLHFHHLTCSEHIAVPNDVAPVRGARYWDPLATFGYLSAHTTTLRFATHVLVLGYHHPLAIAKRYGTLDQVCSGRLILGVGVGSLREEFEFLDADFSDRGNRADDALRALRASMGVSQPEYRGTHYAIHDVVVDPIATRRDVPIWVGGRTARSLRRALRFGDGWAPFGLSLASIREMLGTAQGTSEWEQPERTLEVWLQSDAPLDAVDDPEGTVASLHALFTAGATGINLRFVHHSLAHYLEQLDAFATLASQVSSPR